MISEKNVPVELLRTAPQMLTATATVGTSMVEELAYVAIIEVNDHVGITCCFLVAFLLPPCFAAFSIVRLSTCSDFKKEKKNKKKKVYWQYGNTDLS